jgi:hypothetical protein
VGTLAGFETKANTADGGCSTRIDAAKPPVSVSSLA